MTPMKATTAASTMTAASATTTTTVTNGRNHNLLPTVRQLLILCLGYVLGVVMTTVSPSRSQIHTHPGGGGVDEIGAPMMLLWSSLYYGNDNSSGEDDNHKHDYHDSANGALSSSSSSFASSSLSLSSSSLDDAQQQKRQLQLDTIVDASATASSSSSSLLQPWNTVPLQHTAHVEFVTDYWTDAYNPVSHYVHQLWIDRPGAKPQTRRPRSQRQQSIIDAGRDHSAAAATVGVEDFVSLPMWHTWVHFLEAYHNHFSRFRNQPTVVLMEIGVQSGGKIALFKDYFGPRLTYVGIDINPVCKTKFESVSDKVFIEIGDSGNRQFLQTLQQKYPIVDIFLDDGGHTMLQQRLALEMMLPHVQPEGVYVVEDLSTSWSNAGFGGIPGGGVHNQEFVDTTMFGLVHKTIDWLHYQWIQGQELIPATVLPPNYPIPSNESWWRVIPDQVKHIHVYNQLVVYEKGKTYIPTRIRTVGTSIPYHPDPKKSQKQQPVDWKSILQQLQQYTGTLWNWE